jgi:hypothetical protein
MKELIFIVEEAPEGGYTARALGESIFPRPMMYRACTSRFETPWAAISTKVKSPG